MKYDDAAWHYAGQYPTGLAPEHASTHIGLFVAWALRQPGLMDDTWRATVAVGAQAVAQRTLKGPDFVRQQCANLLTLAMFTEAGNAFMADYYETIFLDDYDAVLCMEMPTFYHVADTWENYDRLAMALDYRWAEWQRARDHGGVANWSPLPNPPTLN